MRGCDDDVMFIVSSSEHAQRISNGSAGILIRLARSAGLSVSYDVVTTYYHTYIDKFQEKRCGAPQNLKRSSFVLKWMDGCFDTMDIYYRRGVNKVHPHHDVNERSQTPTQQNSRHNNRTATSSSLSHTVSIAESSVAVSISEAVGETSTTKMDSGSNSKDATKEEEEEDAFVATSVTAEMPESPQKVSVTPTNDNNDDASPPPEEQPPPLPQQHTKNTATNNNQSAHHVYIMDETNDDHSWIPAQILERPTIATNTTSQTFIVNVPRYKNQQAIQCDGGRSAQTWERRTVEIHTNTDLPLQNVNAQGQLQMVEDMVDLSFLHEVRVIILLL